MSRTLSLALSSLSVLALSLLAACGSDEPFSPCGGNIVGQWNITNAAIEGSGDRCSFGGTPITGFIYFNDNGHYSLNGHVVGWKQSATSACGFSTADAGFFKATGSNVCLADSQANADRSNCSGAAAYVDAPLRGAAEFCVEGNRLRLRSSTLFNLRFPVVFELTRM